MKKRITLLVLIFLCLFLIGCSDDCDWNVPDDYYDSGRWELYVSDLTEAQSISEPEGKIKYLVINNKHSDGSKCDKAEFIIPTVSYGDFYWHGVLVDYEKYQYSYLPKTDYPQNVSYNASHLLIQISKTKNSYYDENNRDFIALGGFEYDFEYTKLRYIEHDGYLITIALPNFVVLKDEEELKKFFTFETQVIRECEVCKAATE